MKKILSILSIGVILGSSSPTLISCNNSTPGFSPLTPTTKLKFDLSKLKVYGFNVSTDGPNLVVLSAQIYKKTEIEILQQFNVFESLLQKPEILKLNNFVAGDSSKLKGDKTWAIQILNGNGNIIPKDSSEPTPITRAQDAKVLKDNALSINIFTNDINVNTKKATIKGYLNRFIYTSTNANKNNELPITPNSKLDIKKFNNVASVAGVPLSVGSTLDKTNVATHISTQAVSTIIINNLNNALKNETSALSNQGILSIADPATTLLSFQASSITLYTQDKTGSNFSELSGQLAANQQIFAKVTLPTIRNYIALNTEYSYLYLGETS